MGMGRAFGLDADVIVFGSLICRASGPDDWATAEPQSRKAKKAQESPRKKERKKERKVLPTDFIVTSFSSRHLASIAWRLLKRSRSRFLLFAHALNSKQRGSLP